MKQVVVLILSSIVMLSCEAQNNNKVMKQTEYKPEINKTEEEWKRELTPEEFRVLREHGTERAFTGKFYKHHETGVYVCAACGNPLFSSDTKYESGSGWPSYYKPFSNNSVREIKDTSIGMTRTEIRCGRCDGHLGHVFEDGPEPTGLRYCINSVSMDFEKK